MEPAKIVEIPRTLFYNILAEYDGGKQHEENIGIDTYTVSELKSLRVIVGLRRKPSMSSAGNDSFTLSLWTQSVPRPTREVVVVFSDYTPKGEGCCTLSLNVSERREVRDPLFGLLNFLLTRLSELAPEQESVHLAT